ncbi:unnamed protein product [Larinioides sclopetarius]|uniref:Uncharacterized protein n=1 Tax=Larinioides sclopetarius TaxID=280406 RepID=A0AAV2ALJ0_9ARAC
MADKRSAAHHDAKEYGTFNSQDLRDSKNEKQQALDSYMNATGRGVPCRFEVDRDAMTQVLLDNVSPPLGSLNSFNEKFQAAFRNNVMVSCECIGNFMQKAFPILRWLPDYSIKNDLFLDVLTGLTLLILHVPQDVDIVFSDPGVSQLHSAAAFYVQPGLSDCGEGVNKRSRPEKL